MWEMAHRRKDFDLIRTNCVDEDQYDLIQNFIRHRDMPFGLPMPSLQEVFGSIAQGKTAGEALQCNVLTLDTWSCNEWREFNVEAERDPDCFDWNLKLKRLYDERPTIAQLREAFESDDEESKVCIRLDNDDNQ